MVPRAAGGRHPRCAGDCHGACGAAPLQPVSLPPPARSRLAGRTIVEPTAITPEWIQTALRLLAGIDIDREEAARVVPWAIATRQSLATIARFDVAEVRSSLQFDPTGPYRQPNA